MRVEGNIQEVEKLDISYMGFIFYPKSQRYVGSDFVLKNKHPKISYIGVFVNETAENILSITKRVGLDGVQLHGDETADFCKKLHEENSELIVIKAFRIRELSDFDTVKDYTDYCDLFVFDSKGIDYGGNGHQWDHELLNNGVKIEKEFLLSGGLDENLDLDAIKKIHPMCVGVDLNSKFEITPAMKNIDKLKRVTER